MKKLASMAAAVVMASTLFASAPVFADSIGQLSNAADNYQVRNLKSNTYAQSATAACGESVKYSVRLANSDFGQLTDLTVKANISTGDINASAKTTTGTTTSVSGKVAVNAAGTLQYVKGSTVRVDGSTKTALADGVFANGVNAGVLKGSTRTFVQFEAKVNCDTPPTTPPSTPEKPAELVKTGAGDVVALFAIVAAAGAVAYNWVLRRQTR